jgi:molybdopterin converting factor small subunit
MLARLRPDAPFDRTEVWPFSGDDPRVADLTAQLAAAKSTIESLKLQITSLQYNNKVYAEALDKLRKEKETSSADEQQQTLAQNLESSYDSMHTFWTEKRQKYSNKGILLLLNQMEKVDDHMTRLMPQLRQGKIRNRIPIEQIQKDVNEISTIQSILSFGYHDYEFSNYMKSVQDVSSILYDYLHPQTL